MRKRELKARIRQLEEQLNLANKQAHYAELVCLCVGQTLDPKNKYVMDSR